MSGALSITQQPATAVLQENANRTTDDSQNSCYNSAFKTAAVAAAAFVGIVLFFTLPLPITLIIGAVVLAVGIPTCCSCFGSTHYVDVPSHSFWNFHPIFLPSERPGLPARGWGRNHGMEVHTPVGRGHLHTTGGLGRHVGVGERH